jgi:hypothetical protein
MFEGRNSKNDASVRQFDMSCHGKVDLAIVLPDDKSKPMFAFIDTIGSGKPDGEVISYHRDGHWDISYWDSKHTGHWDTIGYHPDGKLIPTSFGPYIPKTADATASNGNSGGSAADSNSNSNSSSSSSSNSSSNSNSSSASN